MPLEPLPSPGLYLLSVRHINPGVAGVLISSHSPDFIQVHPLVSFGLLHSLALCYCQVPLVCLSL